jgi:hypothetical protein
MAAVYAPRRPYARSWIRGNVCTRPDRKRVYGYIYDAGSEGGAGMNRFGEIALVALLGGNRMP